MNKQASIIAMIYPINKQNVSNPKKMKQKKTAQYTQLHSNQEPR